MQVMECILLSVTPTANLYIAALQQEVRQVCRDERLPDMIADCESELQENKRYFEEHLSSFHCSYPSFPLTVIYTVCFLELTELLKCTRDF